MPKRNWINFPNSVTFSRLLLVLIFLISSLKGRSWAWAIFTLAAFSDFFDGWLARRFDQVTLVGKVLDPFVDRLLIFSGIISLYFSNKVSLLPIVLIIARDVIIISGYILLLLKRVRMEVTYLGKIATFSLFMVTIIMLLGWGSESFLWVASFLYIISGLEYIYKGTYELIQIYGRA